MKSIESKLKSIENQFKSIEIYHFFDHTLFSIEIMKISTLKSAQNLFREGGVPPTLIRIQHYLDMGVVQNTHPYLQMSLGY